MITREVYVIVSWVSGNLEYLGLSILMSVKVDESFNELWTIYKGVTITLT
jgi:hypothetical protein